MYAYATGEDVSPRPDVTDLFSRNIPWHYPVSVIRYVFFQNNIINATLPRYDCIYECAARRRCRTREKFDGDGGKNVSVRA